MTLFNTLNKVIVFIEKLSMFDMVNLAITAFSISQLQLKWQKAVGIFDMVRRMFDSSTSL
jgi:hypothetical protein